MLRSKDILKRNLVQYSNLFIMYLKPPMNCSGTKLLQGKYPTRYISRTCDVTGIQECSSPGDDIETACR